MRFAFMSALRPRNNYVCSDEDGVVDVRDAGKGSYDGIRVSRAARAFLKLSYHCSTRAGDVMNHSFPGLSGTSAPTSLSDECNALSRAAESSVRRTSPTIGRRDRAVLMPWPRIRWIASLLLVRPILHSQTSRPSNSARRRSFGLKYKHTHSRPVPTSLSGRMTGSKSLIASSTKAVVSVACCSVTGPSGEEPVYRHQPCPGAITKPSSRRSCNTRLIVKLGLGTTEPPRP